MNKEARINSLIEFLINVDSLLWNPEGRKQHMEKFKISRATANRDFHQAFDKVWPKIKHNLNSEK